MVILGFAVVRVSATHVTWPSPAVHFHHVKVLFIILGWLQSSTKDVITVQDSCAPWAYSSVTFDQRCFCYFQMFHNKIHQKKRCFKVFGCFKHASSTHTNADTIFLLLFKEVVCDVIMQLSSTGAERILHPPRVGKLVKHHSTLWTKLPSERDEETRIGFNKPAIVLSLKV